LAHNSLGDTQMRHSPTRLWWIAPGAIAAAIGVAACTAPAGATTVPATPTPGASGMMEASPSHAGSGMMEASPSLSTP